jgi:phosphoribosylformylglycinamidine synthase
MITVELIVRPKIGARDPQADAVAAALHESGFPGCHVGAVGRYLLLQVEADDDAAACARVKDMCRTLLVNPNLETYEVRIQKEAPEQTLRGDGRDD